jgi:hypothetical protein
MEHSGWLEHELFGNSKLLIINFLSSTKEFTYIMA